MGLFMLKESFVEILIQQRQIQVNEDDITYSKYEVYAQHSFFEVTSFFVCAVCTLSECMGKLGYILLPVC